MSANKGLSYLAILGLVVGASATALNPIFVRLTDLDPSASAFHRMAWALPLMWGWAIVESPRDAKRPAASRDRWLLVLIGVYAAFLTSRRSE